MNDEIPKKSYKRQRISPIVYETFQQYLTTTQVLDIQNQNNLSGRKTVKFSYPNKSAGTVDMFQKRSATTIQNMFLIVESFNTIHFDF